MIKTANDQPVLSENPFDELPVSKPTLVTKTTGKQYQFVEAVDYAPAGDAHYDASQIDNLETWKKKDIKTAIKSGLIKEV